LYVLPCNECRLSFSMCTLLCFCSVLQCVAECCRVLQCVAVCCSVLQCAAVRCSVLQCVAVWTCRKTIGREGSADARSEVRIVMSAVLCHVATQYTHVYIYTYMLIHTYIYTNTYISRQSIEEKLCHTENQSCHTQDELWHARESRV